MRTLFPGLAIALAIAAPAPAWPQNAPQVIFCKGQCFFIGVDGIRRAAPKGAQIPDRARFETGPDSYAQIKLGPGVAVGVSEGARMRFDQTSLPGRDVVILHEGRIRMVGGDSSGVPAARALELRTTDGIFALAGADIEVNKKLDTAAAGAKMTLMKLNAGDARLRSGQTDIPIAKQAVQGVTAGKRVADKSFSLAEVAPPPPRAAGKQPRTAPVTDLREPAIPTRIATQVPGIATSLADSGVASVDTLRKTTGVTFGTSSQGLASIRAGNQLGARNGQAPVTGGDKITTSAVKDETTGQTFKFNDIGRINRQNAASNAGAPPGQAKRRFTLLPPQ